MLRTTEDGESGTLRCPEQSPAHPELTPDAALLHERLLVDAAHGTDLIFLTDWTGKTTAIHRITAEAGPTTRPGAGAMNAIPL
jgi:hypothetical protein